MKKYLSKQPRPRSPPPLPLLMHSCPLLVTHSPYWPTSLVWSIYIQACAKKQKRSKITKHFLLLDWISTDSLLPFVLFPEITCETNQEDGHEGSAPNPGLHPKGDHLTVRRGLVRERYPFDANFGFVPHIEGVLLTQDTDT